MGRTRRYLVITALALAGLAGAIVVAGLQLGRLANAIKINGEITLTPLDAPVRVIRDANGTPYIYAQTTKDAIRAQGFITAQDRLLQLELAKRYAQGRLAEWFGPGAIDLDTFSRVVGFAQIAGDHWAALADDEREQILDYVDGLNAYITTQEHEHPFEFKLLGTAPEPWTGQDILTVMLFYAWANSANFNAELVTQAAIEHLGAERAAQLAPITINPEEKWFGGQTSAIIAPTDPTAPRETTKHTTLRIPPGQLTELASQWPDHGMGGSNAWAVAGHRSPNGAAIVANDPHVDVRNLPGFWHPIALITPDFRVLGVNGGLPGIIAGRNDHIAWGITNGYADVVDLYAETLDPYRPDHYVEQGQSRPLDIRQETITVKDAPDVTLTIRSTPRGPLLTDHPRAFTPEQNTDPNPNLDPDATTTPALSLRWAVAEFPQRRIGILGAMTATSVDEAVAVWENHRVFSFSLAIGDKSGRIARLTTGAAPIRLTGDGSAPFDIAQGDNWDGLIPAQDMPRQIDPPQGWAGSANHFVGITGSPIPFTSYASPSFRYDRLAQLFGNTGPITLGDHIAAQRDVGNTLAAQVAPLMAAALQADPDTAPLGEILHTWDHQDRLDTPAPTIFQAVHRHYVRRLLGDDLGDVTDTYLSAWYVWQERVLAMTLSGGSDPVAAAWFDDTTTPDYIETREDLFRLAAHEAIAELSAEHGHDPNQWLWRDVRSMHHSGPLRLDGMLGRLTGNQNYPAPGSGETLNRALFAFNEPGFDPQWSASLRMVIDLADPDKIYATLPGGVTGRTFHPWLDNQIPEFRAGTSSYWWFSDQMIEHHAASTLTLTPQNTDRSNGGQR